MQLPNAAVNLWSDEALQSVVKEKGAYLDIPGYRLYPLKGSRKGIWAIDVSGNWRLTFEFKNGNIHILNYGADYFGLAP